jgi:hypothetical protein
MKARRKITAQQRRRIHKGYYDTPVRKACFTVPCPPWQTFTLTIEELSR